MQRPTNELKDSADQYLRKHRIIELFEVSTPVVLIPILFFLRTFAQPYVSPSQKTLRSSLSSS